MKVAPNAELDDGQFDVIAMGDFGFADLLKSGRRLYQGTHLAMDKVTSRRAKLVEAEPVDPNGIVELDVAGELLGRLPAVAAYLRAAPAPGDRAGPRRVQLAEHLAHLVWQYALNAAIQ